MAKQFLDITGLTCFLEQLRNIFVTPEEVAQVVDETDCYVTNVDYSQIAFDTSEIVTD